MKFLELGGSAMLESVAHGTIAGGLAGEPHFTLAKIACGSLQSRTTWSPKRSRGRRSQPPPSSPAVGKET
ncbi:MAG: hypothetical protein ABSH03_13030 [Candidatus Lustribacter sp.]